MAIKISQQHDVPGSEKTVIDALNDLNILKFCIPKCKQLRRIDDTTLRASADIGVMKLTYRLDGIVKLIPLDEDTGYKVSGEVFAGQNKVGSFDGEFTIDGTETESTISSSLVLTPARDFGTYIEQLAKPLAKKMSNDFFKRFTLALEEREI